MNKNRGMFLEEIINRTIDFYKKNDIAIFHKKNLDIKFLKIEEINRRKIIKNGFIEKKSTADYYGIYKGKYISFEAKSTNLNSLPISNIKDHQLNYLYKILKHKGIAFILIFFAKFNRVFILFIDSLQYLEINKKSISLEFVIMHGVETCITYPGIIDFIEFL